MTRSSSAGLSRPSAIALITITDAAAERLREMYTSGQHGRLIRIGVKTTGCSGLSYHMSWADEPTPADEVVVQSDLAVLVDRKASLFLFGTVMDYIAGGLSSGFVFNNPNEKSRCGCGESFAV